MLKIKDNVDLKELEKFGFKPKYDVDTGKIKKYIKQETYYGFDINIEYIAISVEENSIQRGQYDRIDFWQVHLGEKTNKSIDLLYDLIKADLVEKVDG